MLNTLGQIAQWFTVVRVRSLIEFTNSITPRLGLSLTGGALSYLVPPARSGVERHTTMIIGFMLVTCLIGVWYGSEYRYRRQCSRFDRLHADGLLNDSQFAEARREAYKQYLAAQRFHGSKK